MRTPGVRQRLLAPGLVKRPVSEQGAQRKKLARLAYRHDRTALYEQDRLKAARAGSTTRQAIEVARD